MNSWLSWLIQFRNDMIDFRKFVFRLSIGRYMGNETDMWSNNGRWHTDKANCVPMQSNTTENRNCTLKCQYTTSSLHSYLLASSSFPLDQRTLFPIEIRSIYLHQCPPCSCPNGDEFAETRTIFSQKRPTSINVKWLHACIWSSWIYASWPSD